MAANAIGRYRCRVNSGESPAPGNGNQDIAGVVQTLLETVAAVEEVPMPHGQGERVLFVEDEDLLGSLGKKLLVALGYEVELSARPVAALARVRADPNRYDLVITDQTMPGMTGLVFADEVLKIRPGLPIILMTGSNFSLTSERVKAAGIYELVLKPISIQALAAVVRGAIAARPPI